MYHCRLLIRDDRFVQCGRDVLFVHHPRPILSFFLLCPSSSAVDRIITQHLIMSFLKKLTKEFEELKASFSDEPKKDGSQSQQQQSQHEQGRDYSQQQQYGTPQAYGQQNQYNQQPYGSQHQPPPPQHPPSGGPPPQLPPGWVMHWDGNSQRNYYVETATGRTQWEAPAAPQSQYAPPPPPPSGAPYQQSYGAPGHDASRGPGGGHYDQHQYNQQGYAAGAPGYNPHGAPGPYNPQMGGHVGGYPPPQQEKKDHSTRNMLLAGGAGLAGGALLYNALGTTLPAFALLRSSAHVCTCR
jgi:hypothetical protein